MFVFAEWATAAVRMDRTIWNDPRVVVRARSFIALRLDVTSADVNEQTSADALDVKSVPSVLFFDDLGHEIGRIDGAASADEVLAAMDQALTDH